MSTPAPSNVISITLPTCVTDSSFFKCYLSIVGLSVVYGSVRGFFNWCKWYSDRKPLMIKYKTVEPIVNVSRDAGALAWHIGMSACGSGLVAGTAPVSVPLLMKYGADQVVEKKKNEDKNEDKNKDKIDSGNPVDKQEKQA